MGGVEPSFAAFHRVKRQCVVQPLPKVAVSDRNHLSEELPSPVARPPFNQAVVYALPDVFATVDQSYARRLIQRFEGSNDGQQLKTVSLDIRFAVFCLELQPGGLSS